MSRKIFPSKIVYGEIWKKFCFSLISLFLPHSGKKCGVGSQRTCSHFSALRAYFNNFWQKIPYFDISRQKRILFNCFATKQCLGTIKMALYGSLWLPLWLSKALTATLWHTLALCGSQLLSNFTYTVLDWLSGPLLGSQHRCHADSLSPALPYPNKSIRLVYPQLWCHRPSQ